MREPMSLVDQTNAFNKSNRQHLILDRIAQQRLPVYSSLNNVVDDNIELKTLSFDVYTSKHLATNGKSLLTYSERPRLDEIILPSMNKDKNHNENRHRKKRKRPSYRKSLFHSYSSTSTQIDLAQITAHNLKSKSQPRKSFNLEEDTLDSFERHHAPPPSPSDNEIERLLYDLQDDNPCRSPSRQSLVEKEGYVPFRLPVLHRSTRFRRSPINSTPKDIRSTLSNYLQRYY